MAETFIFFWVFFFLLNPAKSQLDELFFNGFKGVAASNISLNGAAEIESNGVLRLTNETQRVLSHAFYSNQIQFKNSTTGKAYSFSTAFAFVMVPEYSNLGGHGLAFTISPTKELPGALPSQYLGLLNASDMGNFSNHIFAVEFDTVQDFEFGDIDDNHVGIDINSLISNKSAAAAYFDGNNSSKVDLKGGQVIQAWVDYDSQNNQLDVKLSPSSIKPKSALLSYKVDLSPFLQDYMYIGFSSSTGLLASWHYITGWSFKMNGDARALYLDELPSIPRPKKNDHTGLIVGISVSISAVLAMVLVIGLCVYIIRKIKNADVVEAWELDIGPHRFSYKELKKATRGFREKELLGFGGFGKVYKGTLRNSNTQIAVKRISHESKQGVREFASEIASIGRLRHKNLVQLLGWCRRREDLLLVYDFMPNGSLDKYLFEDAKRILRWEERFKIIKGVAAGLLYLHEEWNQAVIHRDIKAGNVLLDSELDGRLGDFGLAKLYEHGSNPSTTRVVGTLGYLAPELTRTGKPTTSSDVFAFGALLLEVVCGRRPIEAKALPEELILVDYVWDKWRAGAILEVLDPKLGGVFDELEAVVVLKLGLLCSNNAPELRPTMRQVLRYLEGEIPLPEVVATPDAYEDAKKSAGVGVGGGGGSGFEDYVNSYLTSSNFEKGSTWSSVGDDRDADVDIEAGSNLTSFTVR